MDKFSHTIYSMLDTVSDRTLKLQQDLADTQSLISQDCLTGLSGRMGFLEQFEELLEIAKSDKQPVAVYLIDLNRFSFINAGQDRATGDEILKVIGGRLAILTDEASLLARWGDDEFVCVMPGIKNSQDASRFASKLLEAVSRPIEHREQYYVATASLGASVFPKHARNTADLLSYANDAMLRSKAERGGQYNLYNASWAMPSANLNLEDKLRSACQEDKFEIRYQPKLDVTTGELLGMEALIRWSDSELGNVSPADFIPLAEDMGLIHELTRLVVRKAGQDFNRWRSAKMKTVPIAINLSPRTLLQPKFLSHLEKDLAQSDMQLHDIEFEITEDVPIQNMEEVVRLSHQLRNQGVKIALDDFGTRHSTLEHLVTLPVDMVKIDGIFIRALEDSDTCRSIVKSLVELAHSMKLQVTAENVETDKQLNYLKEVGCDQMQGYLFYPALRAKECEYLMVE